MMRLLLLLCVTLLVTACGSLNPVSIAQTPEQKADALYATYVLFQRKAVQIAEQPATPDSVVIALAKADAAAKPVVDAMYDAALHVSMIRAEIAAGITEDEQLLIAINGLERWVDEAIPLVNELIRAAGAIDDDAEPATVAVTQPDWSYAL